MKTIAAICMLITFSTVYGQTAENKLLRTEDIRIRDPFVLADSKTQKYYMYAQMDNRLRGRGDSSRPKGVEVYVGDDLKRWSAPQPVLVLPDDFWGRNMVWAPEVHAYRGKYYLFVTITSDAKHSHMKKPKGVDRWPAFNKRGTQIFVADNPKGPFKWFDNRPHTPENWLALDGTLWEEDGTPYMIFCHEWVEIVDGTMEYVRLRDDLSAPVGKPVVMFKGSDAKWTGKRHSYVTDGCFMYRTKSGKLLMLWSSFGRKGYALGIAESKSGKLRGPWFQHEELLFAEDGGHGMIFKDFEGRLMLVFHQPNGGGKERAKFFEVEDTGDRLKLVKNE